MPENSQIPPAPIDFPGWNLLQLYSDETLLMTLRYLDTGESNTFVYEITHNTIKPNEISLHAKILSCSKESRYMILTNSGEEIRDFSHLSMSNTEDGKLVAIKLYPIVESTDSNIVYKLRSFLLKILRIGHRVE